MRTILIVEDDPMNALVIRTKLAGPDRTIHAAETAAAALDILGRHPVDLILLDLVLPDMDGQKLLEQVKSSPATASVLVIVLSSENDSDVKINCYAAGVDGYFVKPVDLDVLAAAVSAKLRRSEAHSVDPPGKKLLLAEDDEVVAALVKHRLSRDGFDVIHVTDGGAALQAADPSMSCIILDVQMPEMGGFEVLERLRQNPAFQRIPILMLTVLGHETDIARGFDLGADDYISKPFSPIELSVRLNRHLNKRR